MIIVNHYVDKRVISYVLDSETPKLEIRQKSVIITDGEKTVFACKVSDFISFAIIKDSDMPSVSELLGELKRWDYLYYRYY